MPLSNVSSYRNPHTITLTIPKAGAAGNLRRQRYHRRTEAFLFDQLSEFVVHSCTKDIVRHFSGGDTFPRLTDTVGLLPKSIWRYSTFASTWSHTLSA